MKKLYKVSTKRKKNIFGKYSVLYIVAESFDLATKKALKDCVDSSEGEYKKDDFEITEIEKMGEVGRNLIL